MTAFTVFVVRPPGYLHSASFQEIAETLVHSLRRLGHDAEISSDPDGRGRRLIVLGSNLLASYPLSLPETAILYNLEQIDGASRWLTPRLIELFARYETWDYSARNAARYPELGLPLPRIVPVGYAPELVRIPRVEDADIDVLFYGSMNDRRRKAIDALRSRGLRVEAVFGVYGGARDNLIARSKIVLNLHFYEAKVFEIVRVSYLLANGRCVVSERGSDPSEEREFEEGVAFAPYDEIVDTCVRLAADRRARLRYEQAGPALMARRDMAAYLRRALDAAGPASSTAPVESSRELAFLRGCTCEQQAMAEAPGSAARSERLRQALDAYREVVAETTGETCQTSGGARTCTGETRLATVLLLLGSVDEAAATFQRVLRRQPEQLEAALGLAEAELARGDAVSSLRRIEPMIGRVRDAYWIAARAAAAVGSTADAALFLSRAAEHRASFLARHRAEAVAMLVANRKGPLGAMAEAAAGTVTGETPPPPRANAR